VLIGYESEVIVTALTHSIDDYVTRLRDRGEAPGHVQRFYVFYDEDLMEIEQELCDAAQSEEFYAAVEAVYREWMREMGEEKWREVEAYN
jgi:hypothetical protein